MTGLEKIIRQIQDEAQAKADEAVAQAQTQAQERLEAAKAEGAREVAAIEARSAAAVAACDAAAESAAALTVRRAVLGAKQQLISEVIENARKEIYGLSDDAYFALLLKMAAKFSLAQPGEICFSASDLKRLPAGFEAQLSKAAKGPLTISDQTREIDGGFVLVYGGIEENCSIEALFYAAQESLQDRVQALLFA
ncbi:MAG: hypothetical protein HFG20_08925 [Anaerotruncus sp.]|nr:hypothetical protein [Anaerotruncus sp.]